MFVHYLPRLSMPFHSHFILSLYVHSTKFSLCILLLLPLSKTYISLADKALFNIVGNITGESSNSGEGMEHVFSANRERAPGEELCNLPVVRSAVFSCLCAAGTAAGR